MITKLYKTIAAATITSLLLATVAVAPVAAQSSSDNSQLGQAQNQSQSQSQGSCATFAQSLGHTVGTGTSTAATPIADCWLSIAPGQKQWYKFHAGARSNKGDENNTFNNSNGVDDSDAAIVQLAMDMPGCVTFEVWTLARLNAPPPVGSDASKEEKRRDKEILRGPVGVGSPEFAVVNDNTTSNSSNSSCTNKGNSSACSDKNRNLARLLWRGGSTVSENFYVVVRNMRTDSACTYRLTVAGPTVSFPGK